MFAAQETQRFTPSGEAAAFQPMQEPRFLKENWKVILGTDCPENLRFVRVTNQVANITNGIILIRYHLPHLPDGFYIISDTGAITGAASSSTRWMSYPDTATCMPSFSNMAACAPIPATVVSELVSFVEFVRQSQLGERYMQPHYILMTREGLISSSDPQVRFGLNLQNLPTGNELRFSPFQLKLALIEMLRYPDMVVSQDAMGGGESPVVFGKDWGHCVLVQQAIANRFRSDVQYR